MTTIKILPSSLCAVGFPNGSDIVYGIGNDHKVYYWDTTTGTWILNVVK